MEQLNDEQAKALEAIAEWEEDTSRKTFCLAGWAGTGKTTVLQRYISDAPSSKSLVCMAPTGKAASVLGNKVDTQVRTIHSSLYHRIKDKDGKITWEIKTGGYLAPGAFGIVDEASMVSKEIYDDLLSTGARFLFFGDPGQLPPVKSVDWFGDSEPDFRLEEIQRQALDSPIIRASMAIREGHFKASDFQSEDCRFTRNYVSKPELLDCDQVITGKNDTRQKINKWFRKELGRDHSYLPTVGDKLVCLKNEHDQYSFANGIQATCISEPRVSDDKAMATFGILYKGVEFQNVQMSTYDFFSNYKRTTQHSSHQRLCQFDYAYAITGHKSQGSEWDSVVIIDDGMIPHDDPERKRWLYTAVTRAKKKLIVKSKSVDLFPN